MGVVLTLATYYDFQALYYSTTLQLRYFVYVFLSNSDFNSYIFSSFYISYISYLPGSFLDHLSVMFDPSSLPDWDENKVYLLKNLKVCNSIANFHYHKYKNLIFIEIYSEL